MKITELTEEHLRRTPVWEYVKDANAEPMLFETELKEITEDTPKVYLVASDFVLFDGSIGFGYSSPQDTSGMDYVQPVLLLNGRHYSLSPYSEGEAAPVSELPAALGKKKEAIFPIKMKPRVPCDSISTELTITSEPALEPDA